MEALAALRATIAGQPKSRLEEGERATTLSAINDFDAVIVSKTAVGNETEHGTKAPRPRGLKEDGEERASSPSLPEAPTSFTFLAETPAEKFSPPDRLEAEDKADARKPVRSSPSVVRGEDTVQSVAGRELAVNDTSALRGKIVVPARVGDTSLPRTSLLAKDSAFQAPGRAPAAEFASGLETPKTVAPPRGTVFDVDGDRLKRDPAASASGEASPAPASFKSTSDFAPAALTSALQESAKPDKTLQTTIAPLSLNGRITPDAEALSVSAPTVVEARGATDSAPPSSAELAPRAPAPFELATITRRSDGGLEIRLDPPDLGSVSIQFFEDDGGALQASITTDRGETLDLLRRHSDFLQRELSRQGAGDFTLNFSDRRESGAQANDARDRRRIWFGETPEVLVRGQTPAPIALPTDRIDLIA
ncbi:MAG: flagellar hook-length control protein FliK [Parvularculaceae bacterium]|nr:flagellar hook-length control protein FliK [Parvularculaceae bacterium]